MPATARKTSKPFTMVRRSIWGSARFRSLPNSDAKLLFFYFLTCPHQTGTGCFVHNEGYALTDLKKAGMVWTPDYYRARKSEVEASELILSDPETGEILIDRWWDGNPPNNEKWLHGARAKCDTIESPALRQAAHEALDRAWAAFREAKGLPLPLAKTGSSGLPESSASITRDEAQKFLKSVNSRGAA
jgi:hypothetical protein